MPYPPHFPTETVSTAEAAKLLKAHVKTVTEMISTGELAASRIGKGYVMLRRDVLALIERRIAHDTAQRLGVAMTSSHARRARALQNASVRG